MSKRLKETKGNYTDELEHDEEDTLMGVDEFKTCVENLVFGPDDGFGHAVKDGFMDMMKIYAEDIDKIPSDATHFIWFNNGRFYK